MPELPEVETVRLALVPAMEGRRIASARIGRPDLRWPLAPDLASRLAGRRVLDVRRRGKYLLVALEDGQTVLLHLGMSGSVRLHDASPVPRKHDHVILEITDANGGSPGWLVFNDPRRFGWMDIYDGDTHPLLEGMGPEPLGNGFSAPFLEGALAGRNGPVKNALLNQRIVAGIGNIYACEALFESGISPRRRARSVRGVRAERLAESVRSVLARAIEKGGTSLRDHVQPGGEIGYFAQSLKVYGRAGDSCLKCGGEIRHIVQSARSSFFCPACQR